MKLADPISVGTAVLIKLQPERFTRLSDLVAVMEDLYCCSNPIAMSRPMTIVAMWMKKPFQVWMAS